MPELDEIAYSRDETVAVIRDYYRFITKMYLDDAQVIDPPPEGWTHITDRHSTLDKSEEVIDLLRYLPYIRCTNNSSIDAEGAPHCMLADWQSIFENSAAREIAVLSTEDPAISDNVPNHVIGLTCGDNHNPRFLLDVELGTILWYECPGGIAYNTICDTVDDDPYDYCSTDEEAEWRAEGQTWSIPAFFEELKERFRRLDFIPLSSRKVTDIWITSLPDYKPMLAGVQEIYRQHGWPDLDRYDKPACLKAVAQFIEERHPRHVP